MTRPSWDQLHFTSMILWAQRSRDPSSQVGCAIVSEDNVPLAYGYNGPPRGVEFTDDQINDMPREEKLMYFEHGERNAIYNALRSGANIKGSTLYVLAMPCCDCARAIIQSGIKCVKVLKSTNDVWSKRSDWVKSMATSVNMFNKAGVELSVEDTCILSAFSLRMGGKEYTIFADVAQEQYDYFDEMPPPGHTRYN